MPDGIKCPKCGTPLPTGDLAGLCPACLLKAGAAADTVTEGKQPPFSPPPVAELAPLFPQLEILELIGKGGMGAVYKARQKQLDRIVALKILPPGIGDDPAFAERFTREARALAKLNHPGIVTLYEFGSSRREEAHSKKSESGQSLVTSAATGELYYFLMEFVDGLNLRQLLHAGRISAREALAIVPQICDALQFAHDQGIVHRDIKPENILMDRRGRVKVADFGLAKIVGGNEPLTPSLSPSDGERVAKPGEGTSLTGEQVMGTPQYMSPEQRDNPSEVDHRADIYALGVVFYQMLTGELPGKRLEPPSSKVQIDVRLDEVVLRALEKKPELRYQQVSEVKTCVETIARTPDLGRRRREESQIESAEARGRKADFGEESQSLLTSSATSRKLTRLQIFVRAFVVTVFVWLLMFALAAAVTSLLPRTYVGSARVKLAGGGSVSSFDPHLLQNEFARMESPEFLKQVAAAANLSTRWKGSLSGNEAGEAEEMAVRLRGAMELRPIRSTDLVEIRFHSESAGEAAEIANAIASVYRDQSGALIIEQATVPLRPIRPNPFLNLAIGVVGGGLLGLIAGGLTALYLAVRKPCAPGSSRREEAQAEDSGQKLEGGDRSQSLVTSAATTHRYGRLAFGLFLAGTLGTLLLMTVSYRHDLALIFGGVALLLAFVFGLMGWRERLGKFVVIALGSVLVVSGMALLGWLGAWSPTRRAAVEREMAQKMKAELAQLERAKAEHDDKRPQISAPTKTILLTRETNQLVGTTTDIRTVGVWSESTVLPGETLRTIVKRPDGEMVGTRTWLSTMVQGDSVRTSSSFSWFFEEKDGFGAIEAEIATRQIRERFIKRPLTLKAFTPLELFCVTNTQGGTLAGSIEFQKFSPAPDAAGKVKVSVQIQHVMGAGLPMIGYSAKVPEGCMLRATASEGEASTQTPAGPYDFNSSWRRGYRPGRPVVYPEPLTWNVPQRNESAGGQPESEKLPVEHLRTNISTPALPIPAIPTPGQLPPRLRIPGQLEIAPFDVVLGEPRLLFSITNGPGDVYQGFLELVGPTNGSAEPSVNNAVPSVPPVVVKTIPESGAAEVDPGLTELRVTFSKPMRTGGWSWVKDRNETFPEVTGETRFLPDGQTCVLPVKLQPGKLYTIWLNHESARNFQDVQKQAALPYLLIFRTKK